MNNQTLFIGIILLFFSFIPLITGIFLLRWFSNFKKRGIPTTAKVITSGPFRSKPNLQYKIATGTMFEKKYLLPYSFLRISAKKRNCLPIRYNPDKPKSFWIEDDYFPVLIGILLLALFAVTALQGIFFLMV